MRVCLVCRQHPLLLLSDKSSEIPGHYDGSQSNVTDVLIKEDILKQTHTERTLLEDESRDGGDDSTSQGMSKIARNPPEARRES